METMGQTKSGLATAKAIAVLKVDDISRAKRFYSETLGLKVNEISGGGQVSVEMDDGSVFTLYERPGMPAPQNTTLAFEVKDFDAAAAELRERGVKFEDYDIPEMDLKTVNGVAQMDGGKSAWFRDTEGNILVIESM